MRTKIDSAIAAKATTVPGARRTTYWDAGMPGFGLMVTMNGHRSYVVQYRAAGRSRRMHLKAGLTLTAARREAKAILGAVARGGDPLTARRKMERAESDTLRAIVEEYLAREGSRLRTIDERRASLQRHVLRSSVTARSVTSPALTSSDCSTASPTGAARPWPTTCWHICGG